MIKLLYDAEAMKNNFEQELHKWAVKAATQCHKIATSNDPNIKVDKYFYAFQTSPIENPELMIIGLNPGADYSYSGAVEKGRTLDDDIEMMEKGNLAYLNKDKRVVLSVEEQWTKIAEGKKEERWKIAVNLKKTFYTPELKSILYASPYMNCVYFHSKNFAELKYGIPGGQQAIEKCNALTKCVVLDIIKPKRILCLGVSDCFIYMANAIGLGENDYKEFAKNKQGKRLLIKKTFNGIPVYAIPHPSSARGISNSDRRHIGDLLKGELL